MPDDKIRANANVSAWPDSGDWDDPDDEWIVGVALRDINDATEYLIEEGDQTPRVYADYASCSTREMAEYIRNLIRDDAKKPG